MRCPARVAARGFGLRIALLIHVCHLLWALCCCPGHRHLHTSNTRTRMHCIEPCVFLPCYVGTALLPWPPPPAHIKLTYKGALHWTLCILPCCVGTALLAWPPSPPPAHVKHTYKGALHWTLCIFAVLCGHCAAGLATFTATCTRDHITYTAAHVNKLP